MGISPFFFFFLKGIHRCLGKLRCALEFVILL